MLPHRWLCLPAAVLLTALAGAQVRLESVRPIPGSVPQVEIVTSAPVTPSFQQLDGPPRLVIDLPNTEFRDNLESIPVENAPIHAIRVDQYKNSPPITRVVVDLTETVPYGTQTQGTRLVISFPATTRPAPALRATGLPTPIPLGRITFSGSTVPAGSAVTAGSDTAILHLSRGGEVRVCPGTTVSVTPSPNGHDMLLGMNTGTIELHYWLAPSSPPVSDSVMTPDFRIVLAGPGRFDLAVHADSHGNTCLRTLPGNSAPISVSELIGDGTYEVKPSEQVSFRAGQIKNVDNTIPATCGCAGPLAPIAAPGPEMQPLPASKPNEVHVTVDAPFVFNANAPRGNTSSEIGAEVRESEALPVTARVHVTPFQDVVIPPSVEESPAKPAAAQHSGFLGKIRRFFGAIFR